MAKGPIDEEYAFDPNDPGQAWDSERLRRIRAERPVCRPAEGVVLTTRYEATRAAFKDSRNFSSVGDMRMPGVVVAEAESFLGELDAPLHPKIRRVLMKRFTRRGAAAAEPWTRVISRRWLKQLAERGEGDLMADLSIPLPGSVSAHEIGIPDELHAPLMGWCDELLHSSWPATGKTERGDGIEGAFPELAACLDALIAERAAEAPDARDDLLSLMVHTRDDEGWQIGAHHARTLVVNILSGSLSASYMLGNLFYRLLDDEDFAATLRAQPDKILAAVDESLRFEPPVTFLYRRARAEAEIGGCPVHRGEHVMLSIAAANRDEAAYEDGERFRLDRVDPPEPLSFGFGPHICVGNHLTRMIGRVVLEEFLDVFAPGQVRLAPGFQWECVHHLQEYGPESLRVVIAG